MSGDVPGPPPPYEEIDSSRSHVLGLTESGYGVWDKGGSNEPVALFPVNDEGYAQAEREYQRLTKEAGDAQGPRLAGLTGSPAAASALGWTVVGGLLVWVVAGAVFNVLLVRETQVLTGPVESRRIEILAGSLQAIAFRVWVGALAVLGTMWLLQHLKKD